MAAPALVNVDYRQNGDFIIRRNPTSFALKQPTTIPKGFWDMESPVMVARPAGANDFPPSPSSSASSYRDSVREYFRPSSTSSVSTAHTGRYSTTSEASKYSNHAAQTWRSSWDSYHGLNPPSQVSPPPRMAIGVDRKLSNKPGDAIAKLPEEIMIGVLEELQNIHTALDSSSCATCWMRDAGSLALTSRSWRVAARKVLYKRIHLVGADSLHHTKKKFKWPHGCRIKLLRRSLRANPMLADQVRELKVPDLPEGLSQADAEHYLDSVASLVMACPNLERLAGFYQPYDHEYSRLVHALSTRPKLLERIWIIDQNPFMKQARQSMMGLPNYASSGPGALQLDQQATFRSYHAGWSSLETLFIHCNAGAKLDQQLLDAVFHMLPSLSHLHLSNVAADSFTDTTLCGLPALASLRLENLSGLTDTGISRFVSRPESKKLASLSLINLSITSLPVLARLFSNLTALKRFTLLQSTSPTLPPDHLVFLHPYLASESLSFLHWDTLDCAGSTATHFLAQSITHHGFPSLRTLRAPCDDGTLQSLCRPAWMIELPTDRDEPLRPSSTKSDLSLRELEGDTPAVRSRSLREARQAAQARMDAARFKSKFHVVVWDEHGEPCERFELGRYLGVVGSPISFSLLPDAAGSDDAVVSVAAMVSAERDLAPARGGCTGAWNSHANKGRKLWQHQERARWQEIVPAQFFA